MPISIEAKLLLPANLVGTRVICSELLRIVSLKEFSIEKTLKIDLIKDLNSLLGGDQLSSALAKQFYVKQVGNVAQNRYVSTSPLLGVISEFLYHGSSAWHLPLVKKFAEAYFSIVDGYLVFSDADYALWRSGRLKTILGNYQSSIDRCSRLIRELINLDESEFNCSIDELLDNPPTDFVEHINSLNRLVLYAQGQKPKSSRSKLVAPEKSQVIIEQDGFSTECIFDLVDGEPEAQSQSVLVAIPDYINTKKQFFANLRRIKGRAAQQGRRNQLRVISDDILRPAIWRFLDELILDETVELQTRQLILLSLLHGLPLDECASDFKELFPKENALTLSLSAPEAKKSCGITVNNLLKVPVPLRYLKLFLETAAEPPSPSAAKKLINSVDKSLGLTPLKMSRLFFYMAEKVIGKTRASLLFPSVLTTINTQLHYTVVCHQVLVEAYISVWHDFESILPSPLGVDSSATTSQVFDVAGINNMPDPSIMALEVRLLPEPLKSSVKSFLIYASENSSRGTYEQAPDLTFEHFDKILGIVNDKKRNSNQHARLALYRHGTIAEVKALLGIPFKNITSVSFKHYEGGQLIQLSPAFFSNSEDMSFAMNAIRKIKHSLLLNLGISEEAIDALYGHYAIGTVPLSSQSSLSIRDIQSEVAVASALFTAMLRGLLND